MSKNRKLKVEELNRISVNEFKNAPKLPVILILDSVRSLNNIGSIFRTSDALNVEKIILCGISATPPHAEIHKTALGAEETVMWEYFEKTEDAIIRIKHQGYKTFAIEQTSESIDIRDFSLESGGKYAFVFGNELKGVRQDAIDLCDGSVEIPQFGTKHSFNVSVTAGIVIWDFFVKFNNL